jgi:hypothetical protein
MLPLEYKVNTSSLEWLLLRSSFVEIFFCIVKFQHFPFVEICLLPILSLLQHVQNDDFQTAFASSKPDHVLSDLVYAGIRGKLRTEGSPHMKALLEANSVTDTTIRENQKCQNGQMHKSDIDQ